MAEQSGDEYLKSLLASSDHDDQALAKRIIDAQKASIAPSPLDKVVDTSTGAKDLTPRSTAKSPKNVTA